MSSWQTKSSRKVYENPWIIVKEDEVIMPNGKDGLFGVVSSKSDAVRMEVDFKQIERALAEYKVYDAWQYIESLGETLGYMTLSRELVEDVYENRINKLKEIQNEIISTAVQNGSSSITSDSLNATNLKICGYTIDDTVFLKKTAIEFFH